MNEVAEMRPALPAHCLQFGLLTEFAGVTQAKIGDWRYGFGNSQRRAQLRRVQNADPANADAFRARCKPEVLNGADGRIDSGFRHRTPSKRVSTHRILIACDTKIDWGFENCRELEVIVDQAPFTNIAVASRRLRPLEVLTYRAAHTFISDNDKF